MISIHDDVDNNFGHDVSNVTMTLVNVATFFFLFFACFIFLKEFIIALKFFLFDLLLLFFLVLKISFVTFIPFLFFVVLHVL
jgi:hypothetical protein